jgi:hypothetical protein
VLNHSNEAETVGVRIEAGADFADLFEVKDALAKKGEHYRRIVDGVLVLGYGAATSSARRASPRASRPLR